MEIRPGMVVAFLRICMEQHFISFWQGAIGGMRGIINSASNYQCVFLGFPAWRSRIMLMLTCHAVAVRGNTRIMSTCLCPVVITCSLPTR